MIKKAEKLFLHLSDQLGVLSILGAGIGGAGLAAMVFENPGFASFEFLVTVVGLVLMVMDYFMVYPAQE